MEIKFFLKKSLKCFLPYGVVRIIQKLKGQVHENKVTTMPLQVHPQTSPDQVEEDCSCINCGSNEFLSLYPEYKIARCSNCGLIYSRKRKVGGEAEKYYSSIYVESAKKAGYGAVGVPNEAIQSLLDNGDRNFFEEKSKCFSSTINNIILPLLGNASEGKWFAEIGCAWGACLLAAQSAGFHPVGFELSSTNCHLAARLGLDVRNEDFSSADIPDASCAVVFFSHSFEHIATPNQYLKKAYAVCEENGFLYLAVPNFNCYWHFNEGRSWSWLDPVDHVAQYTGETLCRMVRSAGFVISKCYTTLSLEKTLQYALHEVDEKGNVLSEESAEKYLASLNSLNKGENLIVIAKKCSLK